MNEKDETMDGLASLVTVCENVLTNEEFNKLSKKYGGWVYNIIWDALSDAGISNLNYGPWAINQILVSAYETTSKQKFNQILQKLDSVLIKGHEKEINGNTPKQTIHNYHEFLKKKGYVNGEDINVADYGHGFLVEMITGCHHGNFCEKTGNIKCIRGTDIKYIIGQNHDDKDFIFKLERPEEGYRCKIKGIPLLEAGDEMHRSNGDPLIIL